MSHKDLEVQRLSFILERDGKDGLDVFVTQTYWLYKAALKAAKRKINFYGRAYRRELIESIIVFRKYLETGEISNA